VCGIIDLIHQAVLDVDAAGIGTSQVANEFLVGWRSLKWVFGNEVENTFRIWFEVS